VNECKPLSHGSQAVKLEGWTADGNLLLVTSFFSPTGLPQLAVLDVHTSAMTARAGHSSTHFSAQCQHFLWATLGTFGRYMGCYSSQTGHKTAH
jgi:hypothetical protein